MVNTKYKNDKIYDTTPVKYKNDKICDNTPKQKPCHSKIAHLSEWHIFLRSLIGAVHNWLTM